MAAACKGLRKGLITSSAAAGDAPEGEGRSHLGDTREGPSLEGSPGLLGCPRQKESSGWEARAQGLWGWVLAGALHWAEPEPALFCAGTMGSWLLCCWGRALGTATLAPAGWAGTQKGLCCPISTLGTAARSVFGSALYFRPFFCLKTEWLLLSCCVSVMATPYWMLDCDRGLKMCKTCAAETVKGSFGGDLSHGW